MHKKRQLQRLWAVLVAVFLAVCCLPTSAFAVTDKVSPKIHVTYMLDGKSEKTLEFWPGEVTYHAGQKVKYSWDKLYEKMELPADTRVKDKKTGACELDLSYKADSVFHGYLTVELEPRFWMDFTIRYVGPDGAELESRAVHMQYSPSTAPDAWDLITGSAAFLNYKAELKELKIRPGDDKAYTGKDQLKINPELKDKTLVAYLGQSQNLEAQTVDFQLRYLSTDNQIQKSQAISLVYDPNGELTDVWDFIQAQDAYKTYAAQGYALADYVVPADGGDRLCDRYGMQTVTAELQGKTVIVHLVKQEASKAQQVNFHLQYTSADGNINARKAVSVPYDPNGKTYDLWQYITDSGVFQSFQKDGYFLKNFVVPHEDGAKTYTDAGQFTVTPALSGKTVAVALDKPVVSTTKTVDFTVQYRSNDGNIDVTKRISAQYDPEGILTDLWAYLPETGTAKSAARDGYTLQSYELDGRTVQTGGVQAVNGDLAGKTVTVNLYKAPVSTTKTVDFQLRYLSTDNQIQKSQAISLVYDPNGELTDVWDFLLAQEPYKTLAGQGYTLSDYVVPAAGGDRLCEHRGMQAVTTELQGKTVIVHLVKAAEKKTETVDFTLRFLSDDGKVDLKKQASVTYDPNGKGGGRLEVPDRHLHAPRL